MGNKDLVKLFREIADLLLLAGADSFRVRSYQRAADTIRGLDDDVEAIAERGELETLPGVGKAIAAKISEFLETGQVRFHQDLLGQFPPGLVDLLEIPELGAKTAKRLFDEVGVTNVDELEAAARDERLRGLKGFGARSEEKLLRNIESWRRGRERVASSTALAVAEPLLAKLREAPGVVAASLAGSLRRGRETTKDIDLLVAAEDGGPAIERFLAATDVDEVIGRGETKVSVRLLDGLNADLRVVSPASWGAALQYFTGSKAHNIALRSRARERGLTINEYGVYPLEAPPGTAPVASRTEAEVYGAVGLPYIEPELREDQGELAAAEAGELPRLIEAADIQGDLHCHSRWSDGRQSIVEMARAARARGYQYLGICDHSKSLTVANGLDERRVREQWVEIAQAQDEVPEVRLLRGIEVDILSDGTLDLPVDLLAELDVVVASVHSAFSQDTERMTARLLAALETGVVDILGHPTGRRIGRREGFTFDLGAVFAVAAELGVAMEINASPERLDLDDLSARRARRQGAWISINTDAHHIDHLDFVRYGIAQARRAWLTRDDVVNTRSLDELLLWLKD